jgi:hypothetical protein
MYGVVTPACAPNDAPAWHFVLSDMPVGCSAAAQVEGFFIDVWTDPLVAQTSYTITPGAGAQGSACLCGVFGDTATSGVVKVDSVTSDRVTGWIQATFKSGTTRAHPFEVLVCPAQRQCG